MVNESRDIKSSSTSTARTLATKVPQLTIYFWILKLLTTALGESTSDYLVHAMSPYLAVGIGFIFLVVALALQFWAKRYVVWVYWLAALAVSVAGTMGADVMHVGFGVPYEFSVLLYLVALSVIFSWWFKSEKTLSIHSIHTFGRELFYWAAVLATFALGTAVGDLTAYTFNLGFLTSGILFGIIFIIPALGYWRLKWNPILSFWLSYIFTRPFGASFADWTAKPATGGGLGWRDGPVSMALFLAMVVIIAYLMVSRKDQYVGD